MVKTVKDKGYVNVSQKRLVPTENGTKLRDLLNARTLPMYWHMTTSPDWKAS
jgi:DNA topoisomerase IA